MLVESPCPGVGAGSKGWSGCRGGRSSSEQVGDRLSPPSSSAVGVPPAAAAAPFLGVEIGVWPTKDREPPSAARVTSSGFGTDAAAGGWGGDREGGGIAPPRKGPARST